MSSKYISYFLVFCLAACANFDRPLVLEPVVEDVLLPSQFDDSVKVQDDIYQLVNGRWLEFHPNTGNNESTSLINELKQNTQTRLVQILTKLKESHYPSTSDEFKLKLLYQKYLDQEGREKARLTPLQVLFTKIDAINDSKELLVFLQEMVRQGREIPFLRWNIDVNYENTSLYGLYLMGPNLVLQGKYFKINSKRRPFNLAQYDRFINTVLQHLDIQNADMLAQKIALLEQKMAGYTAQQNKVLALEEQYQTISLGKNSSVSSSVEQIIRSIKATVDKGIFYTKSMTYFTHLDDLLRYEDIQVLKAYLKYFYFIYYANYLDRTSYSLLLKLNRFRYLSEPYPESIQDGAIQFINNYLGQALGKLYVKYYFSDHDKQIMADMVARIKQSFKLRLQHNDWLSENSKRMALKKLAALKINIAYPKNWQDYHDIVLHEQLSLVQIVEQLDARNYQRNHNKIGQKVDREEWATNPQDTNAWHKYFKNKVIYPAAILQAPFYYPSSDPAVLYGTLGVLIAHEMVHGFDLKGVYHDEQGHYHCWLSPEDALSLKGKTQQLITQYQRHHVKNKIDINALSTLNENIADLGGLNIAYDALLAYLDRHNSPAISGFSPQQRFFLAWASIFKGMSSAQELENSEYTIHSPSKIRVFAPLLNLDAFHEVFHIKPKNKQYLDPKDRIVIW